MKEALRAPADTETLRRFATLLDGVFRIPGTQIRFGLDALLGLLPGIGDVSTAVLAAAIIADAARRGAPLPLLTRMGVNVGLDLLAGSVPVIGDVLDVAVKANLRNVDLLEQWQRQPDAVVKDSKTRMAVVGGGAAAILVGGAVAIGAAVIAFAAAVFG